MIGLLLAVAAVNVCLAGAVIFVLRRISPARPPLDEDAAVASSDLPDVEPVAVAPAHEQSPLAASDLDAQHARDESFTQAGPSSSADAVNESASDEPAAGEQAAGERVVKDPASEPGEPAENWISVLGELGTADTTVDAAVVAATVEVLKLEAGSYRGELIEIDERLRACLDDPRVEAIERCRDRLIRVNESWLRRQAHAGGRLQATPGSLPAVGDNGASLEDVVRAQTTQIKSACSCALGLNPASDPAGAVHSLLLETGRLVDSCHSLRDAVMLSLLSVASKDGSSQDGPLQNLPPHLQLDVLTGLGNRFAAHAVLRQWRSDDPLHKRPLSVALLDIDHVNRLNSEHGPAVIDRLIAGVARLIDDTLRKNRGFDRVYRFAGKQFFLLLGDTGPHGATSAVERIRHTVAASRFEFGGTEIQIALSCGVTEVSPGDSPDILFERARGLVRQAKLAGRNRSYLYEAGKSVEVNPPQLNIKPRSMSLGSVAPAEREAVLAVSES